MGQPIVHFEIMGKDAIKLHKFYAELFNWKIGEATPDMGFYGLIDAESSGLAGGIGQEPDGKTKVTVYVQVPDLQATLDQAVAKGGKVVMPPMEIPGVVTMAQFADPDGNVIGLIKG
ncbi:MAG TPA: VOC family protein [Chloroflexota bacterium]|nr:VOC family protein [Chloroflexota bacterium]